MKTLTFIDLFAGCGGFSSGLERAGLKGVLHLEKDEWAAETLRQNFGSDSVLCADVRAISDEVIDRYRGVDVIVGGPPCQGFSVAGSSQFGVYDARNELVLWFLHWVTRILPSVAVIENVPQILTKRDKRGQTVFDIVREKLEPNGYTVKAHILCAADFGVPQLRKRAFLVASRCETEPKITPTHVSGGSADFFSVGLKDYVTVGQALSDLPELLAGEGRDEMVPYVMEPRNDYQLDMRKGSVGVFNHVAMKHTSRLIERFETIRTNQSLKDVGAEFGQKSYLTGEISDSPFKYNNYRLNADTPSLTIPASFQSLFLHPTAHRNLTAREAARLMSFPDDFIFRGKRTTMSWEKHLSQYNQIGNAVCPLVASAIGEALLGSVIPRNEYERFSVVQEVVDATQIHRKRILEGDLRRSLEHAWQSSLGIRSVEIVQLGGFNIPLAALPLALLVASQDSCTVCNNALAPYGRHKGSMPFLISKEPTDTLTSREKDHGLDYHLRSLLGITHQVAHLVGDELERLGFASVVDLVNERTGRTVRGLTDLRIPANIEALRGRVFCDSVASLVAE